jgi:hypothetical protein
MHETYACLCYVTLAESQFLIDFFVICAARVKCNFVYTVSVKFHILRVRFYIFAACKVTQCIQ